MKRTFLTSLSLASVLALSAVTAFLNPNIEETGSPTKKAPGLLIAPTNPNPPQKPKEPCDVSSGSAPTCLPSECKENGCNIYGPMHYA